VFEDLAAEGGEAVHAHFVDDAPGGGGVGADGFEGDEV